MKKSILFFAAIGFAILMINTAATLVEGNYYSSKQFNNIVPTVGQIPDRIELEQGWDKQIRSKFWFTSQGSQIIPYSWFTWLEQADNSELFRSAEHMELLRFLPMGSSALNPSGLPIGFTISQAKKGKDQWLGMTCASCHTNQLNFNGKNILVEGAPALVDVIQFFNRLADALNTTRTDNAKFDRFAQNILTDGNDSREARKLKEKMIEVTKNVEDRILISELPEDFPQDFTSYGRLDAFGNIENAGSAIALHDLTNRNAPTAPVSYPFLWGTHQSDVVQWDASSPNTPVIGALVRNMAEAVAVFGNLSIDRASWFNRVFGKKFKYSSNLNIRNLGLLESWVKTLRSPVWPEDIFSPIDNQKVDEGKILFDQHCISCHQVIPRVDEGLNYKAVKTLVTEVGTDPVMAWNAANHRAKTLILEGRKINIIEGKKFKEETRSLNIAIDGIVGLVLKNPLKAIEAGLISEAAGGPKKIKDLVKEHANARKSKKEEVETEDSSETNDSGMDLEGLVYKARPLNGIWATAPYLHNGSVPNLWELLQDPQDRPTSFWVGDREFDPVHVGFNSEQGLNEFKVLKNNGDIQPGNSNLGHDYGMNLTDNQKWALVEYMKTL